MCVGMQEWTNISVTVIIRWSDTKVSDIDIVLIKSLGQKIKSRMFDFLVGLCTC